MGFALRMSVQCCTPAQVSCRLDRIVFCGCVLERVDFPWPRSENMPPTVFYCTGNFLRADTGFHHNLLKPLALYESWQHLERPLDFVAAEPIDRSALLLAHDVAYVDQLFGGHHDNAFFSRAPRVLSAELAR
jgi:hypothetical protein